MDSQELTGGNAVRQTGKVAMKKEKYLPHPLKRDN